jgi:hypothetical protein
LVVAQQLQLLRPSRKTGTPGWKEQASVVFAAGSKLVPQALRVHLDRIARDARSTGLDELVMVLRRGG